MSAIFYLGRGCGGRRGEWVEAIIQEGVTGKVRQDRMMCEITLEISPDSFGSYKGALILVLAKHPIIVRQDFIYYHSQIGHLRSA